MGRLQSAAALACSHRTPEKDNMLKERLKRTLGTPYRTLLRCLNAADTQAFRWTTDAMRAMRLIPRARSASENPPRLLVISLTHHMGDTIMMMPMLERLRAANPGATIECAVEETVAPLFRLIPVVDRVHSLHLGGRLPASLKMQLLRPWEVMRQYWRTMRRLGVPDVCIVPRWPDDLFRDRALAYLVGAPRRIGYASTVASSAQRARSQDALLSEPYDGGNGLHESERFCLLTVRAGLARQGSLEGVIASPVRSLQSVAQSVDWAALSGRLDLPHNKPFAVIAPGASRPVRRWPLDRWQPVASLLRQRGLSIVILSGPGDAATGRELASSLGGDVTLVAGATTFVETTALLSHAAIFLGNDSGPGHIAGALGIPTLTIFVSLRNGDPDGYSSVERIHPLGPRTAFLTPSACIPPCTDFCRENTIAHCIQNVAEEDVLQELEHLLTETTNQPNTALP